MNTTGKNRIMIYGPKSDGTYVIEFRTAAGEALAVPIPRTKAGVIGHFQERMPYRLFVRTFREELCPNAFPKWTDEGDDKAGHAVPETLALLHRT
jgi:hypothetical protein